MKFHRPDNAMRATLTLILVFAFCGALAALFKFIVPEPNADLVNFMLGQLSILTAGGVGYYMNTSKSSSDKNKMMADRATGEAGDPVYGEPDADYPSPKFGDR
jgi:hypothetical protein